MANRTTLGRAVRLLASAMTGGAMLMSRDAAAAAPAESLPERSISANGIGEVRVRPDSARVGLTVVAENKSLEQARQMVNQQMAAMIRDIRALDIPNLSIQTQVLQIYPIRGKAEKGSGLPPIVGYHASNGIAVTVLRRSPELLGNDVSRVVDAGVAAGADEVSGVSFFREDLAAPRAAALQQAIVMAERDARTMAGALRVTLGAPLTAAAEPEYSVQPRMLEAAALKASAPTPVEIGEITVTARVTARFQIR